ncbi:glycine oxidase ThiO [Halobacillus halophilus]|uniref:glycine oxidase ThiO n=1 Tax=Halobacillus halophilus TaxID=1570 RepID=UPI00136A74C7|nr:glycine oxidase ThiO [Halobacillus halophilus]MYL31210.1 glycine oxidase ThiO [Halobacillus halophilus]
MLYDAIVVGGGVIGSSVAYQLARRQKKVLVIDRGKTGQKASSAAAGMLGAQSELKGDDSLFQMARTSRAMFPSLAVELKELSGIDIGLQQKGLYKIASSKGEAESLQQLGRFQETAGEKAEWMDAGEMRQKEPALSDRFWGALYLPEDGQVDAPQLTKAYAASASALGADFLEHTDVTGFMEENGRVVGVRTGGGTYTGEAVIAAAGAWSASLLNHDRTIVETYPVKGECFSVQTERPLIAGTLFTKGCYIVPKAGNRLVIGATEQAGSFDESVTVEGLFQLMEKARDLLPSLQGAKIEHMWAGIRPQTKSGIPYVGPHPEKKGLWLATGHYRNGILLSAVTGTLVADQIEGKQVDPDWVTSGQSFITL